MLQDYLAPFDRARHRITSDPVFDASWVCKSGLWPETDTPQAVVLKLHRRHWSPDPSDEIASTSGIFFSVWVDDEAIKKGGLHYNVHALKLRRLPGYKLESRKFAHAFRTAFDSRQAEWPGAMMAYGPQTLFRGFITSSLKRTQTTIHNLATQSIPLAKIIDTLLAQASKSGQ